MIKKDLFWFLELVLTFYTLEKKHKEIVLPQKLFTKIFYSKNPRGSVFLENSQSLP